eukprot:TRINITY_DN3057_c1_g3_i1.p1 TRINITY_DN3057_c1_g3~~TRINITY_DN3057_c1_g3_i1.p1  ORF type:complete len:260 (-),score=11.60 TRINITY_DN3057_c1_g3_i1:321-1100(-)
MVATTSTPEVIICGGIGVFHLNDDFYVNEVTSSFSEHGLTYGTCDLSKEQARSDLVQQLQSPITSRKIRAFIILGVGANGMSPSTQSFLRDSILREEFVKFVRMGGTIFFQGEGEAMCSIFSDWFGKPWNFEGDFYRRTVFSKNNLSEGWGDGFSDIYMRRRDKSFELPSTYCVKACMLSNVSPVERVFETNNSSTTMSLVPFMSDVTMQPGMCPLAMGKFQEGFIGFFGDVNAEKSTVDIISEICKVAPVIQDNSHES